MKTKDIQELYKIKLHSMDTILHQISLMDQVENEQELSETYTRSAPVYFPKIGRAHV